MENKNAVRPRGTDSAKIIKIIQTKSILGLGTKEDPVKTVTQYWTLDGHLIATQ